MRNKKIRFVYMVLVGMIISFLLEAMNIGNAPEGHKKGFDFLISIIITIFVWEGNLRIDTYLNQRYPWQKKPKERILVHLPTSVIFSAFVIYLSMLAFNKYVCEFPEQTKDRFMLVAMIIGILITFIILSIEISSQFFISWKGSLVEVEKYKAESLQAQLQNLKDQVNPHFMFNNLSVLSSLVYKDQDKAVDFIGQLSKVYRYLLDNRGCELIRLREELAFVKSYTYLLQIRFDKNLVFNIDLPEAKENAMLPPMALQMLIENAIKHNEISQERPLTIRVRMNGEMLEVNNNLQLRRQPEESSKTGLKNIEARYRFFTEDKIEVSQTGGNFTVKLPLLKTT